MHVDDVTASLQSSFRSHHLRDHDHEMWLKALEKAGRQTFSQDYFVKLVHAFSFHILNTGWCVSQFSFLILCMCYIWCFLNEAMRMCCMCAKITLRAR